jgi:hypothetical protein
MLPTASGKLQQLNEDFQFELGTLSDILTNYKFPVAQRLLTWVKV